MERNRKLTSEMKLIRNIKSLLLIAGCILGTSLLVMSLQSCTEDLEIYNGYDNQGDEGISLYIPDVDWAAEYGATRNDEYRNSRAVSEAVEGRIHTLWLFAYPDENPNGAEKMVTQLTGNNYLNIQSEGGYKKYTLTNFASGNYHIYLIANFNSYLDSPISEDLTEEELRSLILNFPTTKTLEQDMLPMYCLNTEIKSSENSAKSTSGVFEVKKGGSIYADLTFLCAKVRYTILFDRSANGFSYQFPNNNVNFSGAKVENLAKETKLFDPKTSFGTDELFNISSINFQRKQYPAAGSKYFEITTATSADAPANLDAATSTWTTATAQRAWQGMIYIPENLSGNDSETQTKLSFTPNGENMESSYSFTPRQFKRGQFYDMVAKLKKTEFEVDVNVADWTLSQLAYNLHGPYELIVEATNINIKSGEFSTLGYDTDVKQISFDFPTIKFKITIEIITIITDNIFTVFVISFSPFSDKRYFDHHFVSL